MIGTGQWFQRVQGCSNCKKMFVNIGNDKDNKLRLPSDFKWPGLDDYHPDVASYYRDFKSSGKDATLPVYEANKNTLAGAGARMQLTYEAMI